MDHVREHSTGCAMQGALGRIIRFARDDNLAIFQRNTNQRENVRFNSPFGPFTWTFEPCTSTCTPLGTATGKRPMRDT